MSKLYKSRHLPYRLLVKLIYAGKTPVRIDLNEREAVEIGKMAKSLRTSNGRILEALEWLQALGFITYVINGKKATIKISVEP